MRSILSNLYTPPCVCACFHYYSYHQLFPRVLLFLWLPLARENLLYSWCHSQYSTPIFAFCQWSSARGNILNLFPKKDLPLPCLEVGFLFLFPFAIFWYERSRRISSNIVIGNIIEFCRTGLWARVFLRQSSKTRAGYIGHTKRFFTRAGDWCSFSVVLSV